MAVVRLALANPVRPSDTDLIFFGEPGRDKVRQPYEFRPAWHRTLKEAGIQGLRFHDLRLSLSSKSGENLQPIPWTRLFTGSNGSLTRLDTSVVRLDRQVS